jgi:hypothetical protein
LKSIAPALPNKLPVDSNEAASESFLFVNSRGPHSGKEVEDRKLVRKHVLRDGQKKRALKMNTLQCKSEPLPSTAPMSSSPLASSALQPQRVISPPSEISRQSVINAVPSAQDALFADNMPSYISYMALQESQGDTTSRTICPICGLLQPLNNDGRYVLPHQLEMMPSIILITDIRFGMDATRTDPFDVLPITMSKKWNEIADYCEFILLPRNPYE